jgi:hypothetical protein
MLTMTQTMVPGSRTKRGLLWHAEAAGHSADSRSGAPHALARALVAAGVADQPVEVVTAGLAGVTRYRSLHAMARRTIKEAVTAPIHLAKWEPHPRSIDVALSSKPENKGSSG